MNNFAISSVGIGTALKKSASALAAAGNTLEESIGLVTGMNAVLQNPEVVGTALKTATMYLRASKTEAEEAGESTEGMANSVSELRKELLMLTRNKVDIMIDNNNFKSTYQIFKELAAVWNTLQDVDRANILELIGGKRNATAITSLLTNFKNAEEAMKTAMNASGSALTENEKYLDSINGKIAIMKASFEGLSSSIIGSEFIKGIVDSITSIVNGFTKMSDAIGGFPTVLTTVATALAVFNRGFVNVGNIISTKRGGTGVFRSIGAGFSLGYTKELEGINNSLKAYNEAATESTDKAIAFANGIEDTEAPMTRYLTSLNGAKASQKGFRNWCKENDVALTRFSLSAKAAELGVKALNIAVNMLLTMAISWAISELIQLLTKLKNGAVEASEKLDETFKQVKEDADKSIESAEKLSELIEQYKSIRTSNIVTTDKIEEIKQIQEDIVKLTHNQIAGIDLVNGRLDEEIAKLKELDRTAADKARNDAIAAVGAATRAANGAVGTQEDDSDYYGKLDQAVIDILEKHGYDFLGSGYSKTTAIRSMTGATIRLRGHLFGSDEMSITSGIDAFDNKVEGAEKRLEHVKNLMYALEHEDGFDYYNNEVWIALNSAANHYQAYVDDVTLAVGTAVDTIINYQAKYNENLQKLTVNSIESYKNYRSALYEAITEDSGISSMLKDKVITEEEISNSIDLYMQDMFPKYFAEAQMAVNRYVKSLSELPNTLSKIKKSYDLFNTAMSEMFDKSALSFDTLNNLLGEMGENESLIDYLDIENGRIRLNIEAWQNRAKATLSKDIDELSKETSSLEEQNNELERQIALLEQRREEEKASGDTEAYELTQDEINKLTAEFQSNTKAIIENQKLIPLYKTLYNEYITELQQASDKLSFANQFTSFVEDANNIESKVQNLLGAINELSITIQNATDNNRTFAFTQLPDNNSLIIYIDNQNQVITNSMDINMYPCFNMKFLRLVRGDNILKITGDADIKFICEFPVNIGG